MLQSTINAQANHERMTKELSELFETNGNPVYGFDEEIYTSETGNVLYYLDNETSELKCNNNACYFIYKDDDGEIFAEKTNKEYKRTFMHNTLGLKYGHSSIQYDNLNSNLKKHIKMLEKLSEMLRSYDILPVSATMNNEKEPVYQDFVLITPSEPFTDQKYIIVDTYMEIECINDKTSEDIEKMNLSVNTLDKPYRVKIKSDGTAILTK